ADGQPDGDGDAGPVQLSGDPRRRRRQDGRWPLLEVVCAAPGSALQAQLFHRADDCPDRGLEQTHQGLRPGSAFVRKHVRRAYGAGGDLVVYRHGQGYGALSFWADHPGQRPGRDRAESFGTLRRLLANVYLRVPDRVVPGDVVTPEPLTGSPWS